MLWSRAGAPAARADHSESSSRADPRASSGSREDPRASTPGSTHDARALVQIEPAAARGRAGTELLLQRFADRTGTRLRPLEQAEAPGAEPEVAPGELAVLGRAEEALRSARALSAELREAPALRLLATAEQELLAALTVPGVHAFLAEVYLQLALCAAQLDEQGLFESALERSLSLDPSRRLEAAEAPPVILARARALAQSREQAGLSELRLESDPPGARVWLDGLPIATRDGSIRALAGLHLLLVRAPGHAPYASLMWLAAGKRPDVKIALSPTSGELARRSLSQSSTPLRRAQAASALARAEGEPVYLFELAPGPAPRALLQRCDAIGCTRPVGLDEDGRARRQFSETARARAWLELQRAPESEAAKPVSEKPLWRRWPLWTGAAALVLAGVTTAIWVTRPHSDSPERSLEIDASALPR
jgi:hypothetical protein